MGPRLECLSPTQDQLRRGSERSRRVTLASAGRWRQGSRAHWSERRDRLGRGRIRWGVPARLPAWTHGGLVEVAARRYAWVPESVGVAAEHPVEMAAGALRRPANPRRVPGPT